MQENEIIMKSRQVVYLLVFLLLTPSLKAQLRINDSVVSTFIFSASYAFQFPTADNKDYFGFNSNIGGGILYKTDKNWIHNLNGHFIFGDQVHNREALFHMISTSTGEIIDGDGTFTSLALFQRGYHFNIQSGKLINILAPNPNSGFFIQAGVGYLSHHIRIESQFGTAPQIEGDYGKGYDKMRGGIALSAQAGYLLMSNSRILNLSLSAEYIHAWTNSQRDYSFDTMAKDENKYNDSYFGLRLSWMIPTYRRAPQKYYYF